MQGGSSHSGGAEYSKYCGIWRCVVRRVVDRIFEGTWCLRLQDQDMHEVKTSRSTRPETQRRTEEDLPSRARGVINANYFHIFSLEAVIFL